MRETFRGAVSSESWRRAARSGSCSSRPHLSRAVAAPRPYHVSPADLPAWNDRRRLAAADNQTVVYRATWTGAQPELYVIRPDSRQSGSIGLVNAGIYSVVSRRAGGCTRLSLNWGECLGTLAQVPITGGSPRQMVKDVLVADWSPDGQNMAVVSFTAHVPARTNTASSSTSPRMDDVCACFASRRSHLPSSITLSSATRAVQCL
jgi:hypothetical protein